MKATAKNLRAMEIAARLDILADELATEARYYKNANARAAYQAAAKLIKAEVSRQMKALAKTTKPNKKVNKKLR
jgi:hypothetical protein